MRKTIPPLTQEQTRVLIELVGGQSGSVSHRCHIRAERVYPHPHKYKLLNRGLRGQELLPDVDLQAGLVCRLIQLRLIDPTPLDPKRDVILYGPSGAGRQAVEVGRIHPPEAKQTQFFADVR